MPKKKKEKKEPESLYKFDPSIDLDIGNLPKPWTEKQAKFVFAYLADPKRHATNAAIKAGFSERSAKMSASRMMTQANFSHIQDYINLREQKVLSKWAYDHARHIESTVRQAQANIFDFFKPNPETGQLEIDWREVPYELGELISSIKIKQLSIKQVEGGEEISLPVLDTEFKLWDKTAARDQLNKIMKNYQSIGDSEDNPVFVKFLNDIPK